VITKIITVTNNHSTLSPHSTVKGGIEIKIEPLIVKNNIPESSLTSIKDNWLINLTSITVSQDVQCLIQLGENFSLPTDNKEKTIIELIKNIEGNTNKFDIDTQLTLRNRFIPTINNLLNFSFPNNLINQKLNDSMKSCRNFKNNPDIIFTRTEKGNTTVTLECKDYLKKINDMLH